MGMVSFGREAFFDGSGKASADILVLGLCEV